MQNMCVKSFYGLGAAARCNTYIHERVRGVVSSLYESKKKKIIFINNNNDNY